MKKNSHQRNLFGDARQLSLFHDQAAARPANLWSEADVIATYSRLQAIEDGVLVQLSGPGYQGDAWVPEMVAECGYKIPLAITAAAFGRYVELTPAAERACNDIKGRLWDVLYMLRLAIGRSRPGQDTVWFEFYCVVDRVKPQCSRLKAVCGPGDDGEPVMTIMLPNED